MLGPFVDLFVSLTPPERASQSPRSQLIQTRLKCRIPSPLLPVLGILSYYSCDHGFPELPDVGLAVFLVPVSGVVIVLHGRRTILLSYRRVSDI